MSFEAHGKTWETHVPGDSQPVGDDVMVFVLLRMELETREIAIEAQPAKGWDWDQIDGAERSEIIGYRLAEPEKPSEPTAESAPKTFAYDLWGHLHDEHNLTLVESELYEIIRHVRVLPDSDSQMLDSLSRKVFQSNL